MGEQEYKNLENEVGDLKTTVEDQASEMKIIEVRQSAPSLSQKAMHVSAF